MNKDFLYSKPYVPGIIEDSPADLDSWFLDDSRERMEEKLRNSALGDLILELINIFKDGEPNYQVLLSLLGDKVVKEIRDERTVYCLGNTWRADQDIRKVELEIDEEHQVINKMSVFVSLAAFAVVEDEIISLGGDVHVQQTSNACSIAIHDKTITLFGS